MQLKKRNISPIICHEECYEKKIFVKFTQNLGQKVSRRTLIMICGNTVKKNLVSGEWRPDILRPRNIPLRPQFYLGDKLKTVDAWLKRYETVLNVVVTC